MGQTDGDIGQIRKNVKRLKYIFLGGVKWVFLFFYNCSQSSKDLKKRNCSIQPAVAVVDTHTFSQAIAVCPDAPFRLALDEKLDIIYC